MDSAEIIESASLVRDLHAEADWLSSAETATYDLLVDAAEMIAVLAIDGFTHRRSEPRLPLRGAAGRGKSVALLELALSLQAAGPDDASEQRTSARDP